MTDETWYVVPAQYALKGRAAMEKRRDAVSHGSDGCLLWWRPTTAPRRTRTPREATSVNPSATSSEAEPRRMGSASLSEGILAAGRTPLEASESLHDLRRDAPPQQRPQRRRDATLRPTMASLPAAVPLLPVTFRGADKGERWVLPAPQETDAARTAAPVRDAEVDA